MTEFPYTLTARGARIEPVGDPGPVAAIPEEIGGSEEDEGGEKGRVRVTELAPYVLSRTAVEELYLPSGLEKIGAYAFYNCDKLRYIRCSSRIRDLGAGLFAGAGKVERLDLVLFEKEKSCLKELLSELPQTLRVRIREAGSGREARLIFPEFYEESIENTPARILVVETHGCGHRYRYCFYNTEFQYQAYDELFPQVQIQESEALAAELAFGRMRYPLGLTEKYREMYAGYLCEHWRAAGKLMMEADLGAGEGEFGYVSHQPLRGNHRVMEGHAVKGSLVDGKGAVRIRAVLSNSHSRKKGVVGMLLFNPQKVLVKGIFLGFRLGLGQLTFQLTDLLFQILVLR